MFYVVPLLFCYFTSMGGGGVKNTGWGGAKQGSFPIIALMKYSPPLRGGIDYLTTKLGGGGGGGGGYNAKDLKTDYIR